MKLKIGAINYTVVEVYDITGDAMAEIDPVTCEIKVLRRLNPQQKKLSLLHEIFHAINSELSEFKTDALAQGMLGVLTENPDLFSFKYD